MYKTKASVLTRLARLATASYLVIVCVACSSDDTLTDSTDPNDLVEIKLSGELNAASAETRGVGPITGDKPSSTVAPLSLDIFRADATSAAPTYPYSGTYATTALSGSMAANGKITIDPTAYYLADGNRSTKLVALYPAVLTSTPATAAYTNGNTVTYNAALDGSTDIMFGKIIQGNRGTAFGTMTFVHLLTQVRVRVKGSTDAARVWGKVTNVTISEKKVKPVITLPASTEAIGTTAVISSTGGTDVLPVIATTAELSLPTDFQTYGYAMFIPVTNGKLTFNITTEENGNAQTLTTTTAQDFDGGKIYNIDITFTVTGITISEITAELTDWTNGGTVTENFQ